ATGTFSDGTVAVVTASATWSSDTPAVAAVLRGRVTGVAAGGATVTATIAGVSARASVAVASDVWTPAAPMPTARLGGATARTMSGGTVRVTGGAGPGAVGLAAVDLFDPATRTWQPAGTRAALATPRSAHSATLLADGRVLVVGGSTPGGAAGQGYVNVAGAEI